MKLFSKFYLIFISFRLIVQYNAHSINESNKLPVMHRQIMEAAAILFQTKFISSAQRETICRLKFIKNRGNSARQTISIDARICESGIYIPVEREMVIIANYQPMFSGALSIGNLRLRKKYWKKKPWRFHGNWRGTRDGRAAVAKNLTKRTHRSRCQTISLLLSLRPRFRVLVLHSPPAPLAPRRANGCELRRSSGWLRVRWSAVTWRDTPDTRNEKFELSGGNFARLHESRRPVASSSPSWKDEESEDRRLAIRH